MTRDKAYIGGKTRKSRETAPVKFVYMPQVKCACGRVYLLPGVTPKTMLIIQPCAGCGALIRWTPGGASVETVAND